MNKNIINPIPEPPPDRPYDPPLVTGLEDPADDRPLEPELLECELLLLLVLPPTLPLLDRPLEPE